MLEAIATKSDTILPPHPRPNFLKPIPASTDSVRVGEGPVHVMRRGRQLFNDIKPEMMAKMRRTKVISTDQSLAGSLTSQAYHKRWW